jgi:hypothetical protein
MQLIFLFAFLASCSAIAVPVIDCTDIKSAVFAHCCGAPNAAHVTIPAIQSYITQASSACGGVTEHSSRYQTLTETTNAAQTTEFVTVTLRETIPASTYYSTDFISVTVTETRTRPVTLTLTQAVDSITQTIGATLYVTETTTQTLAPITSTQTIYTTPVSTDISDITATPETVFVTSTLAASTTTITETITPIDTITPATVTVTLTDLDTLVPITATQTVFATITNTAQVTPLPSTTTVFVTTTLPASTTTAYVTPTASISQTQSTYTTTYTAYSTITTQATPVPDPLPNQFVQNCETYWEEAAVTTFSVATVDPICTSNGWLNCYGYITTQWRPTREFPTLALPTYPWYYSPFHNRTFGISACDFGFMGSQVVHLDFGLPFTDYRNDVLPLICDSPDYALSYGMDNNSVIAMYIGTHVAHSGNTEVLVDFSQLTALPFLQQLIVVPYTAQVSNPALNMSGYPTFGLSYEQAMIIRTQGIPRITFLNMRNWTHFDLIISAPGLTWIEFINCTFPQYLVQNLPDNIFGLVINNPIIVNCTTPSECVDFATLIMSYSYRLLYLSLSGPVPGQRGLGYGVSGTYQTWSTTNINLATGSMTLELLDGLDLTQATSFSLSSTINIAFVNTFSPSFDITPFENSLKASVFMRGFTGSLPLFYFYPNSTIDLRGNSWSGSFGNSTPVIGPYDDYYSYPPVIDQKGNYLSKFYLDNPHSQVLTGPISYTACVAYDCQITGYPQDATGVAGICVNAVDQAEYMAVIPGASGCCCGICTICV